MYNFRITNVIIGSYKIFIEVQNEETEEREYITIPSFFYSTEEEKLMSQTIEKKCPKDLIFQVEKVNSYTLYKEVCNTLDEYVKTLK